MFIQLQYNCVWKGGLHVGRVWTAGVNKPYFMYFMFVSLPFRDINLSKYINLILSPCRIWWRRWSMQTSISWRKIQMPEAKSVGHVLALLGSSTETHSGRPTFPFYLYDSSKSIDCLVAGVRVNNGCCCICCLFLIFRLIKYLLHFNTDYVLLLLLRGFIVFFFPIVLGLSTLKSFPLKCDVEKVKWMNRNEWIFLSFINMSRGSIWYNKKSLLTSCLFVFSWNTINCIEGLICFSFFKSKEMWEIKAANPGLNRRLRARSVHVHAHGIPSLCRGLALLLSFLSSVFAPNSKFFFRMYQNTALLYSEGNAFFSCSQTSTWKHLHLGRERPCGLKWMPAFKLLALTCCDPDGNGCWVCWTLVTVPTLQKLDDFFFLNSHTAFSLLVFIV